MFQVSTRVKPWNRISHSISARVEIPGGVAFRGFKLQNYPPGDLAEKSNRACLGEAPQASFSAHGLMLFAKVAAKLADVET